MPECTMYSRNTREILIKEHWLFLKDMHCRTFKFKTTVLFCIYLINSRESDDNLFMCNNR